MHDNTSLQDDFKRICDNDTIFVEVLIPLPIPKLLTYSVSAGPVESTEMVGCRVAIPFQRNKVATGIILNVHTNTPKYNVKSIIKVLEEVPSFNSVQIKFLKWLSSYYMCELGEVLKAAMPTALTIDSTTLISLNRDNVSLLESTSANLSNEIYRDKFTASQINTNSLLDEELFIINHIKKKREVPLSSLCLLKIPDSNKKASKIIDEMLAAKVLVSHEKIQEKYVPKIARIVYLDKDYFRKDKLDLLFQDLEKNPKQLNILLEYFKHVPINKTGTDRANSLKSNLSNTVNNEKVNKYSGTSSKEMNKTNTEITMLKTSDFIDENSFKIDKKMPHNKGGDSTKILKSHFNKDYLSSSALNTLIKKEIFIEEQCIVSRLEFNAPKVNASLPLTKEQKKVLEEIYGHFNNDKITLLHGVTGSGKTEIYVSMIKEVVHAGGEVLMLMPEIALTTHMVMRLRRIFGNDMNVFHSRYSNNERAEVWNNVKYGKVNFIIGTRSAIFLPFSKLSLIIVDEEHDFSYKQTDPAPRYNARDSAIILAKLHNAKVLLGTATPSIESYYNAKKSKYALVMLSERFNNIPLPKLDILSLKNRNESDKESEFSKDFLEIVEQTISPENDDRKQVLIFQNRRGYAPYIMCEECLWIPYCKQCDVSLTYHQQLKTLKCHYCGNKSSIIHKCALCGSNKIKNMGFGTEKLEETLSAMFPQANIARIDLDTARNKTKYIDTIQNIKNFTTDIIVGTQMISKGFDFDNIGVVGIIGIDRLMRMPNFRAKERAFQLAVQVGGRCGRKGKQGNVIIQTYNTKEPLLKFISNNEYEEMYNKEVLERKAFFYPPFSRLVKITFKHKSLAVSKNAALFYNKILKYRINIINNTIKEKGGKVAILGPESPVISKIKNLSIIDIWLKFNCYNLRDKIKLTLRDIARLLHKEYSFKQVKLSFDVDPI